MKKNNLTPKNGLSLSQAQSISNLCNQRATEIESKLSNLNNFTKTVKVDGKDHELQKANPIPENVVDLLKEKATLHACQAFLMENIKAKDKQLTNLRRAQANVGDIVYPEHPEEVFPTLLDNVEEDWGWEQLSATELNEFMEAEAFASHIGQFIHKKSTLDTLRKELPTIPAVDWMEIEAGKKTPVTIKVHPTHTSENLLKIHEELAALHRGYEQRVNYYKAKVKNLVTKENARIAKENADATNAANKTNSERNADYTEKYKAVQAELKERKAEFEKERQAKIEEVASCRINVDARFQETIDLFLEKVKDQ